MNKNRLFEILSSGVLDLDEICRKIMVEDHITDTRFVTFAEHCFHICNIKAIKKDSRESGREYLNRSINYILDHARPTVMETE